METEKRFIGDLAEAVTKTSGKNRDIQIDLFVQRVVFEIQLLRLKIKELEDRIGNQIKQNNG
jgi:hypothetical protein